MSPAVVGANLEQPARGRFLLPCIEGDDVKFCLAIGYGHANLDAGCRGLAREDCRCSPSARRLEKIVWRRPHPQSIRDRDLSTYIPQKQHIAVDRLQLCDDYRDLQKSGLLGREACVFTGDQNNRVSRVSEKEGEIS